MTDLVATVMLVVGVIAVFVVLAYAEYDRTRRAHRFVITLRRSHLTSRPGRGRWRWYLHPTFTPDAIDVIVGTGRSALAGWARTPLGALNAARRSRTQLEADLAADRRAFLANLTRQTVVEDDTHAVFPPETSEGRA